MIKKNEYKENVKIIDKAINEYLVKLDSGENLTKEELNRLETLIHARVKLQESEGKRDGMRINPNTVISAIVGLTSMTAILNFEKLDVIKSKAFSLATKWIGK